MFLRKKHYWTQFAKKKSNYVLCARKEKKNPVDVLKHSSNRDKQVFH